MSVTLTADTLTCFIGSAAAGIQAGIGNIAAGSAFAVFQSAGAGGAGLLIINGIVQGIAGVGFASGIAASVTKTKAIRENGEGDERNDEEEHKK